MLPIHFALSSSAIDARDRAMMMQQQKHRQGVQELEQKCMEQESQVGRVHGVTGGGGLARRPAGSYMNLINCVFVAHVAAPHRNAPHRPAEPARVEAQF
jgi:hypothetical protein